MKVEQPANGRPEIRVCVLALSYACEISRLDQAIDLEACDINQFECGIDINGKGHGDRVYCSNMSYNELNDEYCKVAEINRLSQQQSDYTWLPSMLEYFWQNGVDEKGLAVLRKVGFVHSYK